MNSHDAPAGGPLRAVSEAYARADRSCRPLRALYEITYRCNLDCRHCYVDHSACPVEAPHEQVLDALRYAGVLFIVITGGEPLVRDGWRDIILALRSRRMAYRILTNGTLLTSRDVKFLGETGASAVDVSIYAPPGTPPPDGSGTELHDYVTGSAGSLDKALAAVRMLRSKGIPVVIKSPLFSLNYVHAAGLKRLALDMGCGFVADTTFVAPASAAPACRGIDEPGLRELFTSILPIDRQSLAEAPGGNLCGDIVCSAGRSTLRVRPDGAVTPCVALPGVVARASGREIADAWRSHPALVELRNLSIDALPD
ncbi:MAG: radical SAM protein, partial [Planctomycetes bacterium]|nr:radical SAM protein [Planctomycetota bacterium]